MNTKQNAKLKFTAQVTLLALASILCASLPLHAQMSVEVEGDVLGENAGMTDSMILGGKLGIGTPETNPPVRPLHVWGGNAGTDPGWQSGTDQVIIEDEGYAIIQLFTPNDGQGWVEFSDPNYRVNGAIGYTHDDDKLHFYTRYGTQCADRFWIGSQGRLTAPALPGVGGIGGDPLYMNANGYIGYQGSSIQYKENVRDLQDTSWIYELRPRLFDYKAPLEGKDEYGLIAEEVEKVAPQIVRYKVEITYAPAEPGQVAGDVGEPIVTTTDQPDGVRYDQLTIPMLAEMQKMRAEIEALKLEIAILKGE